MTKARKIISFTICLIFVLSLTLPIYAESGDIFTDIGDSPYKEAVLKLHEQGIVNSASNQQFYPKRLLTKAEASALLVRSFKLPTIEPMIIDDPTIEKKFSYSDPLQVIDESFAVPSANDITDNWGCNYIEGLIKVRADEVTEGMYQPNASVTKAQWVDMIAKVIFGADQNIDFTKKAVELGLVSEEAANSQDLITREEAAGILDSILSNPEFKVITVFVTADIHGHLDPYKPRGAKYDIGGLAKMNKIIKEFRKIQPNTLLLDVGDAPYNTNIANLFEGASTIEVMNEMKYDAMAIGNHDFDFPFNVMKRNAENAVFPFLSANTYYNNEYPEFLKPSIIKEVDGVKIGIIGATDDESNHYTHPKNVEGITFKDHFEATQEAVNEIKDGSDIVIALAHLHGDNPILPTKVEGIDIEIGGGQDVVAFPENINGTWLISPGKHAEVLNQININVLNNEMIGFNFSHIFMTENLELDPAVESIIESYRVKLDSKMKDVVGKTTVELDGERQTVRLKESNLANVIADSLIELTGADIALQNGGGVRASIDNGEITMAEVYGTLPFDNTVVVVEASGETIWKTLEHGVSSYPSAAGGFLQVSGLEYTFDASKDPGSRIVEVLVNGEPIDKEKIYKVAANDFLTGGGDKYTMLKEETKVILKTKHFLRDAFVEYLQKHNPISPELEGRITILNVVEE